MPRTPGDENRWGRNSASYRGRHEAQLPINRSDTNPRLPTAPLTCEGSRSIQLGQNQPLERPDRDGRFCPHSSGLRNARTSRQAPGRQQRCDDAVLSSLLYRVVGENLLDALERLRRGVLGFHADAGDTGNGALKHARNRSGPWPRRQQAAPAGRHPRLFPRAPRGRELRALSTCNFY
jgi:hypothetical protein